MNEHLTRLNLERIAPYFIMLVGAIGSVLAQGFEFPTNNNIFHLPIVLDYANSIEGPVDVFHQSLGRFASGFWPALSLVSTETNAYSVFLGFHIATRLLTLWAVWKIVMTFDADRVQAALLVGILFFLPTLFRWSALGYDGILTNYLTHTSVATALIMVSWTLLLRQKYLLCAALLGLVFNINAFVAIWSSLIAGTVMLTSLHVDKRPRIEMARMTVKMAGWFLLVALPTAIWILNATINVAPHQSFSFGQYLREFFPHHAFVDTHWFGAISMAFAFLISLGALAQLRGQLPERFRVFAAPALVCLGTILLFGTVLPYVADSRLLFMLHPLRMDVYVVLMLATLVIVWCSQSFRSSDGRSFAYAVVAFTTLINGHLLLLLVAITLASFQLLPGSENQRWRRWLPALLVLLMGATHLAWGTAPRLIASSEAMSALSLVLQGGAAVLLLPKTKEYVWQVLAIFMAALIGAVPETQNPAMLVLIGLSYLAIVALVLKGQLGPKARRMTARMVIAPTIIALVGVTCAALPILLLPTGLYPVVALLGLSALVLVPGFKRLFDRYFYDRPWFRGTLLGPAYVGLIAVTFSSFMIAERSISRHPAMSRSTQDVQLWARNNTDPHTVFLPVGIEGFSTLSRRPVWVDGKVGAMVMWAPETYALWSTRWARLRQVKTVSMARQLAVDENIDYIVVGKNKLLPINIPRSCIPYENDHFWIMHDCPAGNALGNNKPRKL
jgi:hypothetical protein